MTSQRSRIKCWSSFAALEIDICYLPPICCGIFFNDSKWTRGNIQINLLIFLLLYNRLKHATAEAGLTRRRDHMRISSSRWCTIRNKLKQDQQPWLLCAQTTFYFFSCVFSVVYPIFLGVALCATFRFATVRQYSIYNAMHKIGWVVVGTGLRDIIIPYLVYFFYIFRIVNFYWCGIVQQKRPMKWKVPKRVSELTMMSSWHKLHTRRCTNRLPLHQQHRNRPVAHEREWERNRRGEDAGKHFRWMSIAAIMHFILTNEWNVLFAKANHKLIYFQRLLLLFASFFSALSCGIAFDMA